MSEETTIDNGPQQDSGEKLVGVECYLWGRFDSRLVDTAPIGELHVGVVTEHDSVDGLPEPVPYRAANGWYVHARPVALGLPEGGALATEQATKQATEVEGDALNTFPEDGDPDARKVHDLLQEVGAILIRRSWPGVALALTQTTPNTLGGFGFNIFSTRSHLKILVGAGVTGLALAQAAQILDRR
jgi:hypothetical protein